MTPPNLPAAPSPGLPEPNSVVAELVLTPMRGVAGSNTPLVDAARTYRILRTTEVDPKDAPVSVAEVVALDTTAAPVGDDFAGTARKAAKLSIAPAKTEIFGDLQSLLQTLPAKSSMTKHTPKITTEANSKRVKEEDRNVRLRAFLYAASREADNDFHLIIGRDPASVPHVYMNVEVSGLPPHGSQFFAPLQAVRKAYKDFFGQHLPGTSYDFYDPPIPVEIEGSLFFDMSHAQGEGPGPASLRKNIPTIWEIHPVSKIVLEP